MRSENRLEWGRGEWMGRSRWILQSRVVTTATRGDLPLVAALPGWDGSGSLPGQASEPRAALPGHDAPAGCHKGQSQGQEKLTRLCRKSVPAGQQGQGRRLRARPLTPPEGAHTICRRALPCEVCDTRNGSRERRTRRAAPRLPAPAMELPLPLNDWPPPLAGWTRSRRPVFHIRFGDGSDPRDDRIRPGT